MQNWFTCEPGYEAQAAAQQEVSAMSRLKDMYYESHVRVLIKYYADVKREKLTKKEAKKMLHYPHTDLDREIYLSVIRKTKLPVLP